MEAGKYRVNEGFTLLNEKICAAQQIFLDLPGEAAYVASHKRNYLQEK
ncbi:MAG: hypothetical protein ACX939_13905 [Hyphococcus sp.]